MINLSLEINTPQDFFISFKTLTLCQTKSLIQLAGAIEYTHCVSAEG